MDAAWIVRVSHHNEWPRRFGKHLELNGQPREIGEPSERAQKRTDKQAHLAERLAVPLRNDADSSSAPSQQCEPAEPRTKLSQFPLALIQSNESASATHVD